MTRAAVHVTQAGETYLSHTDVWHDGEGGGEAELASGFRGLVA